MTEVGDAINWSDVARAAFEKSMFNHNNRKGQAMNALERLRVSKNEYYGHLDKNAVEDGRKWASVKASFHDLKEVSKMDFAHYENDTNGFISYLYRTLDELRALPFENWVSDTFGVVDPGDDWAFYFAKGAQAFFAEIKDQL